MAAASEAIHAEPQDLLGGEISTDAPTAAPDSHVEVTRKFRYNFCEILNISPCYNINYLLIFFLSGREKRNANNEQQKKRPLSSYEIDMAAKSKF